MVLNKRILPKCFQVKELAWEDGTNVLKNTRKFDIGIENLQNKLQNIKSAGKSKRKQRGTNILWSC